MKAMTGGRFLAFEIDGNEYAIEVERVEVVLETMPITRVPQAPAHLKGVINYRGAVIPVADLRTRFSLAAEESGTTGSASPTARKEGGAEGGLPPTTALVAAPDPESKLPVVAGQLQDGSLSSGASIVVLHVDYAGDDIVMGVMADAVREVMDIDAAHINKAPSVGSRGRDDLVAGIGEKDGRFIVILDMEKAFNFEDGYQGQPETRREAARPAEAR